MNCDPLSDNNAVGGPNNVVHLSNALMTVKVFIFLTGTNMQNLENLSIIATIYLYPSVVCGNGPQISMDTHSNGDFAENVCIFPDLNDDLFCPFFTD